MSFETSIKRLKELSEKIRDEETSLDDAIQCYEEGIKCYTECSEILNNARQKIETFSE